MEAKYKRKLVPYQVYLRPDQVEKLRETGHGLRACKAGD